jgi:hypothetical protein
MTTVQCVRCKFIRGNGQRCKRTTCVRRDYCWQHLRSKLVIDVRPSAGMGLFAYENFPNGSQVASYSGKIKPVAEAKDSQYENLARLSKNYLIFGDREVLLLASLFSRRGQFVIQLGRCQVLRAVGKTCV